MYTNWSLFIGRFHPLVVHLPIGILLFTILVQVLSYYKKITVTNAIISTGILSSFVCATLSIVSGLALSQNGDYQSSTVFWHQWLAITLAVLLLVIWLLKRLQKPQGLFLKLSLSNWLLLACLLLVVLTGHQGAALTHGEGYLSKYLPERFKKILSIKSVQKNNNPATELDSVEIFRDIVQPLLNKRCVGCHRQDNAKGELVLSAYDSIMKGGKSGSTIVAGEASKSELYRRITMPENRPKFMPTGNGIPLTPIEIYFIKYWIDGGARTGETISPQKMEDKKVVAAYLGISADKNIDIRLPVTTPADTALLKTLRKNGLIIRPLTSSSALLEVSFVMKTQSSFAEINKLLSQLSLLKKQVYELDLSNCKINEESVKIVSTLTEMNKLNVANCGLTDAAIVSMKGFEKLTWLNLSGNELTDNCLSTLKSINSLKKLYVWQTKLTRNGLSQIPSLQSQGDEKQDDQ